MTKNSKSIADRAYELWLARGQPHGSPDDDWLNAEQELRAESSPNTSDGLDESLTESFPASDAPGSQLPDLPPSNAGDKWKAADRASKP